MASTTTTDCCQVVFEGIRLFLLLTVWPVISIVLGIAIGVPVGVIVAVAVVLFTIFVTPVHICKTIYVAATSKECFQGCCLGTLLRIMVLLLTPLPHILFLIALTVFVFTYGIMYYVGKTSRIIYKCDFRKAWDNFRNIVRLDPKTHLGQYYVSCRDFMKNDSECHKIIYSLKRLSAFAVGAPVGAVPFLPLSIAVLAISIARLPINIFTTMKIATVTVLLEWDLRLLALVSLPLVHTVFPLVAFVCAIVGSFFYFTFQTTDSIYNGESPFAKWNEINEWIHTYHNWHVEFVGGLRDTYDHPSGIPDGWRGNSYGLPVRRILLWQWDFFVCCLLIVYSLPISLAGTIVLAAVKLVPSCIYGWYKVSKKYCQQASVNMIATWPFFLATMLLLVPLGVIFFYFGLIVVSVLYTAISTPALYVNEGYLSGFYRPFGCLGDIDEWSDEAFGQQQKYIYGCLHGEPIFARNSEETAWRLRRRRQRMRHNLSYDPDRQSHRAYWDRFASQCVSTTADLLRSGWVSLESVQDVDPAAVQVVPGVAILSVLVDSVMEPGLGHRDFKWNVDGTLCRAQEYDDELDATVKHLMRLILDIRSILSRKKKTLCTPENVQQIRALLCSNSNDDTEALKSFLRDEQTQNARENHYPANNLIRTKVNGLVLSLLRVKPYQERMTTIFSYDYAGDIDSAVACGTEQNDNQEDTKAIDVVRGDEVEQSRGV